MIKYQPLVSMGSAFCVLLGILSPFPISASVIMPLDSVVLLRTAEGEFSFEPSSIKESGKGLICLDIYGNMGKDGKTKVKYEINCPERSFRQIEVIESRNGDVSRCSNPSESITLKPEKHLIPAALFEQFCR